MRKVTLTKAERRMWPILEVQVRQVRKDGSKIRGSSKWVSYCQREIRRMLPKRVRVHFGLTACALVCLLATGCATLTGAPYKDALKRVGEVGPRIADDIKPVNAGGEARKAAFLDLVAECQRLGSE